MPDPAQLQATFAAYISAIESRDRDALLACFTDDVVQVDPYPAEPNTGKDAVLAFFEQTWALTESMKFVLGRVIVSADRGVFPFTVRSVVGGTTVEVDTVDVVTFNDDALMAAVTAYVDMAGMRSL